MRLTMAPRQMIEMSWWGSLEVKYFFPFLFFSKARYLTITKKGTLQRSADGFETEEKEHSAFDTLRR